jgi:hypothetical protein
MAKLMTDDSDESEKAELSKNSFRFLSNDIDNLLKEEQNSSSETN